MKRLLIYSFGAIMVSASTLCSAEVILREIYKHYAIEPQTVIQIKQELREKTPVSKSLRLFHGGTEWKLTPKFGVRVVGNLCQIFNVSVKLDGTYTLPKMTNRTTASEKTQLTFDQYYQSLVLHEKGHQALWLEAGEKIEMRLQAFPEEYHCNPLAQKAKQAVAEIVLEFQQRNRDYDKHTGHGKTQGAFISAQGTQ